MLQGEGGSGGRTRTCDQVINSHPLYQLSYAGTRATDRTKRTDRPSDHTVASGDGSKRDARAANGAQSRIRGLRGLYHASQCANSSRVRQPRFSDGDLTSGSARPTGITPTGV